MLSTSFDFGGNMENMVKKLKYRLSSFVLKLKLFSLFHLYFYVILFK